VKEIKITAPKNPNKWGKTLAPWFNETCREAKRELARTRREFGKGDTRGTIATRAYLRTCQKARLEFAA
jgi:TctA family transporter